MLLSSTLRYLSAQACLVLLLVLPGAAWSVDGTMPAIESAKAHIEADRFEDAITDLTAIRQEGLEDGTLAEINFLLGKAKFILVSRDIRSCRADGTLTNDELNDDHVPVLKESLEHMFKSHSLDAESPNAVEALYAAAIILDYGCLNRFEDALETYRKVSEMYPDTPEGEAAGKRYRILKMAMDGTVHGGHPGGTGSK